MRKSLLSKGFFWGTFSRLGFIWAVTSLLLDQLHKYWTLHIYGLPERGLVKVSPFLDLVMVWNKGISYGLFQQEEVLGRTLLLIFIALAILVLIIWLAQARTPLSGGGLGLIIGGALSNAIDRTLYGAVADFFSFHIGSFYWYVFNIADAAIVAGVLALLYDTLREGRECKTEIE